MLLCNIVAMHNILPITLWRTTMSKETIEKLNEMGRASYEASRELTEINAKTLEEICEQQMALANLMIENVTTQMKLLGTAKDIKEVMGSQTEISADMSGKIMGIARNTTDIIFTDYRCIAGHAACTCHVGVIYITDNATDTIGTCNINAFMCCKI